jgi:hypothetical protein
MLLEHVIMFDSLWDWYSFYKEQKLETYQSRRDFLREKYDTIIAVINNSDDAEISAIAYEPPGWEKIDESIDKIENTANSLGDYNSSTYKEVLLFLSKRRQSSYLLKGWINAGVNHFLRFMNKV